MTGRLCGKIVANLEVEPVIRRYRNLAEREDLLGSYCRFGATFHRLAHVAQSCWPGDLPMWNNSGITTSVTSRARGRRASRSLASNTRSPGYRQTPRRATDEQLPIRITALLGSAHRYITNCRYDGDRWSAEGCSGRVKISLTLEESCLSMPKRFPDHERLDSARVRVAFRETRRNTVGELHFWDHLHLNSPPSDRPTQFGSKEEMESRVNRLFGMVLRSLLITDFRRGRLYYFGPGEVNHQFGRDTIIESIFALEVVGPILYDSMPFDVSIAGINGFF